MKHFLQILLLVCFLSAEAQTNNPFGNALIPEMMADPSIVYFDGNFYCYATTDGYGKGLATSGPPVVWKSKDFVHWSFDGTERYFPSASKQKFWAPSKCIKHSGRYYIYPTVNERMYALVADTPEGPFRLAKGEDCFLPQNAADAALIPGAKVGIDAEYFIDDDGSKYIFWNQRHAARLLPDMATIDTSSVTTIKTGVDGYSEGPIVFKRNGIYYYLYTISGHETYRYNYVYGTQSPLGPYTIPQNDTVAVTDSSTGVFGPGHGCVFEYEGQYYFAFLEYGRSRTNRQIYVNKLNFNEDGTIQTVEVDLRGVGTLKADDYGTPVGIKSVSASSCSDSLQIEPILLPTFKRTEYFYPEFALDGENGSRWMACSADSAAWLKIDLGKKKKIGRSEIAFVMPTAGHAYILEGSTDGKTWYSCGGHSDIICRSPHVDIIEKPFRYLRVRLLEGEPGIWEWTLWE